MKRYYPSLSGSLMKTSFFLLLFSLLCFSAFAQNEGESYLLMGQVVNLENDEPLPFVTVYNKDQQKGVTSDTTGIFSIRYQVGDSIIFQTLGYDNFVLKTDDRTVEELSTTIKMQQKTYELRSVDITAFRTAEDLKNHIMEMEMPEEEKIEIPGLEMVRREVVAGDGVFRTSGPISALYNTFGRRAKEHRKYLVAKEGYDTQQRLDQKYNVEVVKKILKVDDPKELDEFMSFCKLQDSFIESANEYELIVAVNNCYDEFKLLKNTN